MYAYITGRIAEKSPTYVVLDNHGIGYLVNITLNTFTAIGEKNEVRLYTHEQILEDAHNLFGWPRHLHRIPRLSEAPWQVP